MEGVGMGVDTKRQQEGALEVIEHLCAMCSSDYSNLLLG
jgi:hypothetical protein